jgi:hypothetical protein
MQLVTESGQRVTSRKMDANVERKTCGFDRYCGNTRANLWLACFWLSMEPNSMFSYCHLPGNPAPDAPDARSAGQVVCIPTHMGVASTFERREATRPFVTETTEAGARQTSRLLGKSVMKGPSFRTTGYQML